MRDRPLHEAVITDVLHITGVTVIVFAPQKLNFPDSQYTGLDSNADVLHSILFPTFFSENRYTKPLISTQFTLQDQVRRVL